MTGVTDLHLQVSSFYEVMTPLRFDSSNVRCAPILVLEYSHRGDHSDDHDHLSFYYHRHG